MKNLQDVLIAQQLQTVQKFLEMQHFKQAQLDNLKAQIDAFEPGCSLVLPIRIIACLLEKDLHCWQQAQLSLIEKTLNSQL